MILKKNCSDSNLYKLKDDFDFALFWKNQDGFLKYVDDGGVGYLELKKHVDDGGDVWPMRMVEYSRLDLNFLLLDLSDATKTQIKKYNNVRNYLRDIFKMKYATKVR